jgi:hypothetical protein
VATRHPVDVVLAVDLNRGVEAGQRRGGLEGRRNGHVVASGLAEDGHVGGVEIHGHDVQLPLQSLEVVGAAAGRKGLGEKALEGGIREKTRGDQRPERCEKPKKGQVAGIEKVVAEGGEEGPRQALKSPCVFAHRRTEEDLWFQVETRTGSF